MPLVKGRSRANTIMLHLNDDELEKLNQFAKDYETSREEFMRDAIEYFGRYINREDKICLMKTGNGTEVLL